MYYLTKYDTGNVYIEERIAFSKIRVVEVICHKDWDNITTSLIRTAHFMSDKALTERTIFKSSNLDEAKEHAVLEAL